ncbi:hypothetical protein CDAR_84191 [Caerostris darwini]|uniref:Uncharacterized protein n=1 Tax=Caerostris darwini TaxID=1538125 RepID=A0AAV4U618_9ARAC|nr:hypothetical protein CDAR_84191 [Caerostris darwini]
MQRSPKSVLQLIRAGQGKITSTLRTHSSSLPVSFENFNPAPPQGMMQGWYRHFSGKGVEGGYQLIWNEMGLRLFRRCLGDVLRHLVCF